MAVDRDIVVLTDAEIIGVSGGESCELADGQAGHGLGDRHKGESKVASMWRAIKEAFFGGDHCG